LADSGDTADAERLAVEAEILALTITDDQQQGVTLTGIVETLHTAGNTTNAERIAHTITDDYQRTAAIIGIVKTLTANGNTTDAERIANSMRFGSAG